MSKKGRFNPHKLLQQAGYSPAAADYGDIARYATKCLSDGMSNADVLAQVARRYPHAAQPARAAFRPTPVPINYFGEMGVDFESEALNQIKTAARLPVAVHAAVMPDGHPGYALPIGGVIALENAVSPAFVGYDIACRMTLTVLDLSPDEFMQQRERIAGGMLAVSSFGLGSGFRGRERRDHPVMADPLWKQVSPLKALQALAAQQLGSSGGGNHFFDALIGEVTAAAPWMPLPVGAKFVAVMTHSGSRGVGNKLAHHYVNMAQAETAAVASGIPRGYEWLPLNSEAGQEYWEVMQLMGRYAQANHHLIHDAFLHQLGLRQIARWENHHNFAFKEGNLIVHRKGATPAEKGRTGIIPGSSGTPSYLVEGLGNADSLNSSSHGAGRPRSRTASRQQHNEQAFQKHMHNHDILAFGVDTDETFMAYKDIERVMALQEGTLVRSIARMLPSIVIMGGRSDDGD